MNIEDYKKKFQPIFMGDFNFNRRYQKEADEIIVRNLAYLIDHETRITKDDQKFDEMGFDRTLKLPTTHYGLRIRRPEYIEYWDVTFDTKELIQTLKMRKPEYYIYGYGTTKPTPKELLAYILFDHRKFIRLVEEEKIKATKRQNKTHSLVPFYAFDINQLFKHRLIIDYGGTNEEYFPKKKPPKEQTKLLI